MKQTDVVITCPECHSVFAFENEQQVPAHCRVCNAAFTPAKPEAEAKKEG